MRGTKNIEKIKKEIKKYSEFCQKVLLECLKIPVGEVRTYKWIARKIGHPKAYRAVGNILSKNPFSPIIPCHRVIRSDGKLGGYSKGIDKKISLLKKEKALNIIKLKYVYS